MPRKLLKSAYHVLTDLMGRQKYMLKEDVSDPWVFDKSTQDRAKRRLISILYLD
jgi:hypothetical protein